MIDSEQMDTPESRERPYHTLLRDLARAQTSDGVTHLAVRSRLLCGVLMPEDALVGESVLGQDAVRLCDCRGCKRAFRQLRAGFRAESAPAPSKPSARRLSVAALVSATPEQFARELLRLERRNYLNFWLYLAVALGLGSIGLSYTALFCAFLGCLSRLSWLKVKQRVLGLRRA